MSRTPASTAEIQPMQKAGAAIAPGNMTCLVKERLEEPGVLLTSRPVPSLRSETDVRIKVWATAICGTDKHIFNSEHGTIAAMKPKTGAYTPVVIGHEFCGTVESVGSGVTSLRPGDYVTAEMHLVCGRCYACRTGNAHVCTETRIKGLHDDGCFAQYVVLPESNVILLGRDRDTSKVPPQIAAFLDAIGNAAHTVQSITATAHSVAVLGAGPIGLAAVAFLRTIGASTILVTDAANPKAGFGSELVQQRLKLAQELGADHVFDVADPAQHAEFKKIALAQPHGGVDAVIEMSGSYRAYEDAFDILRMGGEMALLGLPNGEMKLDFSRRVIFKGITLRGVIGRRMYSTWYFMLDLIASNRSGLREKLQRIVTHPNLSLEQHGQGFDAINRGAGLKVVMYPNGLSG
jgi:threonine 3-dehydrogenase